MATGDLVLGQEQGRTDARQRVVNDFSINVATVNGSGSQSANSVLLKSIFGMGVPVSGKNLFPSNIAGLPTWYTIRASKDGYVARKRDTEILVALNPETAKDDILGLPAGAVAIYEENLNLAQYRNDVVCYAVPFDKITASVCPEAKLRKLVKNMVYVGVVAQLLSIDLDIVEKSVKKQFAKKQKVFDLNFGAVKAGWDFAAQKLVKHDPFVIEHMNETAGKIIIDGNAACGMGSVFAGVTVVAWYPITPSTSLVEATTDILKKYRVTPEGKATFAVVQAEDELAAIGMVLGAGWAGARSMTATSGPGISLMGEFAGLGYYAEIPGVIFDVQRSGPSTGMPTRTQQADVLSTAFLSHGDTKHILLFPGSVKECFELAGEAFDIAERLQTPVFVLTDLDLGMNNWMSDQFEYPTKPLDRGKVLTKEDLDKLGSFARYKDVDGDAIGWRTLPGTMHPKAAYFTRGSGHNASAGYTEKPDEYQYVVDRLTRKFESARTIVPAPQIVKNGTSKVGFIAYGSSDYAVLESLDQIKAEYKTDVDYLRVRAYPFAHEIHDFIASHERVYIIEQNRDAQMESLLKLDLPADQVTKLRSILYYAGLPLDARSITDEFATKEGL
ncbi:2-oxoacid:acceptor oxidoreductase subunit alpha [Occallatibacter riparius]|uniref:2-oxoacid:acceptor oxidoreductase subunit alpha n=1 Tax=Occallatibacter riparius TaxID=1002689 RepID=A0A9J7BGI8_9BACT|nr:2-oxoacid:acceptor oxidoreductase subunit alpha [Occallatibacter riparius]UWZ81863.1 2-oxoacid:acceptor oxidoreductase subunit alpha [Occallatibacter riparius]